MITIDQLLESVDLDFEPRFVTKDDERDIVIWAEKPTFMEGEYIDYWDACGKNVTLEKLKLAEFDGKDCTECIYEVPQKTTEKIKKITGVLSTVNGKRKIVFPSDVTQEDIISKLHEVIDAVNELKGAKNE